MNCVKCGREISDSAKFCPYCGKKVEIPTEPKDPETEKFLKLALLLLAGVSGVIALKITASRIEYFSYKGFFDKLGSLFDIICAIGIVGCLVMIVYSKEREKIKMFFLGMSGASFVIALNELIRFISAFIRDFFAGYFSFPNTISGIIHLILLVILMAGLCGIAYCLLMAGGSKPDLSEFKNLASSFGNKNRRTGMNYGAPNPGANYNSQRQNAGTNYNAGANYNAGTDYNAGTGYNGQGQAAGTGNVNQCVTPLKTNRGLLGYVFLSILTCGIYGYYFVYTVARDVNTACEGDGKSTGGLFQFLLLSILTCGIYSFWWQYSLGNRLAENAPRYGLSFSENGTSVLLWIIFGSLLCGIGPFIAMNIIIKNTNNICMAYNLKHGLIG